MAQMERNVNLEEIDADALFGIDALKGQSFCKIDILRMPVCRHSDQCLSSDVFENSKSSLRTVISVTAFCRHCLWL